MEGDEDVEEAFRALKASIVAALEAALAGAPVGYTWLLAHPFFALKKTGGDEYCLVGMDGGERSRLSKKQAVGLILMFMVQELINDG